MKNQRLLPFVVGTFLATGFLAVGAFEPKRPESGDDAFAAGFPTAFRTAFFGLLLPPPLNIAGHTAGCCCCTAIARRGAVAAICQADAVATQATKIATSRIVGGRMLSDPVGAQLVSRINSGAFQELAQFREGHSGRSAHLNSYSIATYLGWK